MFERYRDGTGSSVNERRESRALRLTAINEKDMTDAG